MTTTLEQVECAVVKLACTNLTDLELAAINKAAQADFDPRPVMGYEKVKHLFTETDGLRMHNDIKEALAVVVLERLT